MGERQGGVGWAGLDLLLSGQLGGPGGLQQGGSLRQGEGPTPPCTSGETKAGRGKTH